MARRKQRRRTFRAENRHSLGAFVMVNTSFVCGILLFVLCGSPSFCQSKQRPATPSTQYLKLGTSFASTAARLGPNFCGHDIEAVITTIEKSGVTKPRSEFETTAQYEARRKVPPLANRRFVFVLDDRNTLLQGPQFTYDADAQLMNARAIARKHRFQAASESYPRDESYPALAVKTVKTSGGSYEGMNAFGARAVVTETYLTQYGIVLPTLHGNLFKAASSYTADLEASASIPLSAERAKHLKSNLRLAIVCRFTDILGEYRLYEASEGHDPTLSNPYHRRTSLYYIPVWTEELLLFDFTTGEVLKRVVADRL